MRISTIVLVTLSLALGAGSPARAQEAAPRRNVAILVYPGVELLDFAGPGEVFAAAGHGAFRVYTVAETTAPVKSMDFLEITPGFAVDECPDPDIVVVPGGNVPAQAGRLQRWIQECAGDGDLVMSVCNGAALLASSGLLGGLEVTTHHGTRGAVQAFDPTAVVLTNRRFVDHGNVLTTAGISAGIDGALHVVARLLGEEEARGTAEFMEYDWRPEEIAALHAEPGVPYRDRALELLKALESGDADTVLADYRAAQGKGEDVAGESELNSLGYRLWQQEQPARAETVLRFVTAAYPESPNAWDSLSELVESTGSRGESLCYARRALEKLAAAEGLSESWRARIQASASGRVQRLEDPDARVAFACVPCGGACDEQRFAEAGTCPACSMPLRAVTVAEPVEESRPVEARAEGGAAKQEKTGAAVYVCPPCGGECDAMEWHVEGNCSECAMPLVKKEAGS